MLLIDCSTTGHLLALGPLVLVSILFALPYRNPEWGNEKRGLPTKLKDVQLQAKRVPKYR